MKGVKKNKKSYVSPRVYLLREETVRMAGECEAGSSVGALHESCESGGGAPMGCLAGT